MGNFGNVPVISLYFLQDYPAAQLQHLHQHAEVRLQGAEEPDDRDGAAHRHERALFADQVHEAGGAAAQRRAQVGN